MISRILQSFGIASIMGAGVVLGASPAKAISYTFSGTSTFDCNNPIEQCTLTFNDFTADWNGTDWTMDSNSLTSKISITNGSTGDIFSIPTFNTNIDPVSNNSNVLFNNSGNFVGFTFSSLAPASPITTPSLLTLDQIQVSFSDTQFNTSGLASLNPGPQAYAAPYFASVLSVIPMLAASKRIKRRVLST